MSTIYAYEADQISGNKKSLADYKGQVVLIVNTASKCGFTPQFAGLEKLYEKYKDQGFTIIGFPCNQFGKQDPGDNSEIQEFCQLNYGVSFPMFAKVDVNGKGTHPLFEHLKSVAPGALGTKNIKWNFTKFLVNRDGEVVERFAPATAPEKLESAVQALL